MIKNRKSKHHFTLGINRKKYIFNLLSIENHFLEKQIGNFVNQLNRRLQDILVFMRSRLNSHLNDLKNSLRNYKLYRSQ